MPVESWNPLTDWKEAQIHWVKVKISPEDLRRFTQRNNVKGLCQSLGFLLLLAATGSLAWYAFSRFVADQLPPKEKALPRLFKLHRICQEKYGSWQNWRDNFGRYKGL